MPKRNRMVYILETKSYQEVFSKRGFLLWIETLRGFDSSPYIYTDTRKIKPIVCNFRSQKEELNKQGVAYFSSTISLYQLNCLLMEWISLKQSELLASDSLTEAGQPPPPTAARVSSTLHLTNDIYVTC